MLNFVPEPLNLIQFRAVGWQEVNRQPLHLQKFNDWLQCFCSVNRGVVYNQLDRLSDVLCQQSKEAAKYVSSSCLPVFGAEDFTSGEQSRHDVELLASLGFNQVTLAYRGPRATVGMDRGKARFVGVCQDNLACSRLDSQLLDLCLSCPEREFISFFLESDAYASTLGLPCAVRPSTCSGARQHLRTPHAWRAIA